jgi:hypothetical protein
MSLHVQVPRASENGSCGRTDPFYKDFFKVSGFSN